MKAPKGIPSLLDELGDFTVTARVLPIALLAGFIGAIAAVVAVALLRMIALFTNLFFYQRLSFANVSPAGHHLGYAAVLVPVVGALIIGALARWGSEKIRGHGIPEAIEAILVRGSRVEPRIAVLKPIASAISIGSGGPFGAEGPIIMTGGAIGSLFAQLFALTSAERKTLLVAGAAAGMSATFASPLAATLLAVELLLFEWKPRSFLPVVMASVTAAFVRPSLLGDGPLFAVPAHVAHASWALAAACVLCGLLAGGMSGVLTKGVYLFEDLFQKLPIHWMWWPALGGVAIGLGGLVEPRALGVGYDIIEAALNGHLLGRALIVLMLVKATIWVISLGSGTSGGVLAPLLIMGACLGGLEARFLPGMGVGFWPLVSMAAILGGTMRSPLTGIVFALELTHDWGLVLPLLVAVPVAYGFTALVLRRSILTEKVSRRGFHLSREYATEPLEILFVREVMRTNVVVLPAALTRAELLVSFDRERPLRPLFHVVDAARKLVGVVTRSNLESWMLGQAPESGASLDVPPPATLGEVAAAAVVADADEPLSVALSRMARTGRTWLPVVAHGDPREIVGEITLDDTLKARVKHLEEEQRRERILPVEAILPQWLRSAAFVPGAIRSKSPSRASVPEDVE
ncbi:MAG TPA: chloride channel protein [Labilithrix sp.]|nr:chloride channel protein [Labilithrix sp.]